MATISYLEYSKRDMKYAEDMFMLKNFDPCGRFCQQSVEKRMKYYIEIHGDSSDLGLFSVHSLTKLYARVCQLAEIQPDRVVRGDLNELTTYYFDTNYPQKNNIELTEDMAKEAIEIAENINSWIDKLSANSLGIAESTSFQK